LKSVLYSSAITSLPWRSRSRYRRRIFTPGRHSCDTHTVAPSGECMLYDWLVTRLADNYCFELGVPLWYVGSAVVAPTAWHERTDGRNVINFIIQWRESSSREAPIRTVSDERRKTVFFPAKSVHSASGIRPT